LLIKLILKCKDTINRLLQCFPYQKEKAHLAHHQLHMLLIFPPHPPALFSPPNKLTARLGTAMDLKNSEPTTFCHVVALPAPGRGHINPMMNLCKSLSSKKRNLLITFIVTEEWLGFIGSDPKPDNIRFSTVPNVIPSEVGRGADSPSFYEEVLRKMRAPVEELLDRLEPRPITIMIADTYLNWAIDIGNRRNVPVASLWTMSALVYSVFHHFDLLVQHHHFPVDFACKYVIGLIKCYLLRRQNL
jgi:hypothetical protein